MKFLKDALNDGHAIVANLGDISSGDGHCVMIYAVKNRNFKVKDSHGVKYEIPIDRPDFYQVTRHWKFVNPEFRIIFQGLIMKAINNPQSAGTDPILLQKFPDPKNPLSLDPQFSTCVNQFGSAAHLGKLLSYYIQSRFFQIFLFQYCSII